MQAAKVKVKRLPLPLCESLDFIGAHTIWTLRVAESLLRAEAGALTALHNTTNQLLIHLLLITHSHTLNPFPLPGIWPRAADPSVQRAQPTGLATGRARHLGAWWVDNDHSQAVEGRARRCSCSLALPPVTLALAPSV